jgi:hypothetical protein
MYILMFIDHVDIYQNYSVERKYDDMFFLIITSWWVPYMWQEILCGSWSMTFQRTLQIEEHSHINILVNLDVIEE